MPIDSFQVRITPKEYTDLLAQAVQEPDFETRQAMAWELSYLMVDRYCFCTQIYVKTNLAVNSPEMHGDGIYEINHMERRALPGETEVGVCRGPRKG